MMAQHLMLVKFGISGSLGKAIDFFSVPIFVLLCFVFFIMIDTY